jgi:hypothetical protein
MLIATALAIALTVNVSAPPDISPTLVSRVLAEADAIWRYAGFAFEWERVPHEAAAASLQVVIGHDVRGLSNGALALGWIVFADSAPLQQIYVSYENALQLLVESPGVVGPIGNMPVLERETLLARAMGRVLAHEMGHYLLSSKAHTQTGLMRARITSSEFFSNDQRRFKLDNAQRSSITARLSREWVVAHR